MEALGYILIYFLQVHILYVKGTVEWDGFLDYLVPIEVERKVPKCFSFGTLFTDIWLY